MTNFGLVEIFLCIFESSRRYQNEITDFEKNMKTGQICGARSDLSWAGPGGQRLAGTESVPDVAVRPIRLKIDGGGPSSLSRRGWGKTLALATGRSRSGLT
jgi:hypothetical protein